MRGSQSDDLRIYRLRPRVYLGAVPLVALPLFGAIIEGWHLGESRSLAVGFRLAMWVVWLLFGVLIIGLADLQVQITGQGVLIRHLFHCTRVSAQAVDKVSVCTYKRRSRYLPEIRKIMLHVLNRRRPLVLVESNFKCASGEMLQRLQQLVHAHKQGE